MSTLTTDTPTAAQLDPRILRERRERRLQYILPIAAITFALGMWEFLVWYNEVPHYLIPAPSLIVFSDPVEHGHRLAQRRPQPA